MSGEQANRTGQQSGPSGSDGPPATMDALIARQWATLGEYMAVAYPNVTLTPEQMQELDSRCQAALEAKGREEKSGPTRGE